MKKKLNNKITAVVLLIAMLMTQSALTFADTEPAEIPAAEPVQTEVIVDESVEGETPAEEGIKEEPASDTQAAVEESEKDIAAAPSSSVSSADEEKTTTNKTAATTKTTAAAPPTTLKSADNTNEEGGTEQTAVFPFDNSTDIPNGIYEGDAVTFKFTGGTGKAKLTLDKLVVEDGKATATFTASSATQTHIYLAHTSSSEEDTALYDPDTDKCGEGVYPFDENRKVTIPVRIGKETDYAVRSTVMSDPHWIQYQYTITVDVPAETDFDNSTTLKDGTYNSDKFTFDFSGGTGKAKLDLESVTVKNGKATGTFKASSERMTHVYLGESP